MMVCVSDDDEPEEQQAASGSSDAREAPGLYHVWNQSLAPQMDAILARQRGVDKYIGGQSSVLNMLANH
jgi:hypothetical protein